MGKPNRRKGNKNKTQQKERQQKQNRERKAERSKQEAAGVEKKKEKHGITQTSVFPGDRVWFYAPTFAGRGIVLREDENHFWVEPFDTPEEVLKLGKNDLFRDLWAWTVPLKEGQKVVCCVEHRWLMGIVIKLWPIEAIPEDERGDGDTIAYYQCRMKDVTNGGRFFDIWSPRSELQLFPESFRFGKGEQVLMNANEIVLCDMKESHLLESVYGTWLVGEVIDYDVQGLVEYYGYYTCRFYLKGKEMTCHILRDIDELIVGVKTHPRKRLFDAIEHGCMIRHIRHLVREYQMDASPFVDIVIAKATQCANYDALLWLEKDLSCDLARIKDTEGNNVLHKVAESDRAAQFFEEAATRDRNAAGGRLSLFERHGQHLVLDENHRGETYLQVLTRRGDVRSLEFILSPLFGLFKGYAYWYIKKEQLESLLDFARSQKIVPVIRALEDFQSSFTLHRQRSDFSYIGQKSEDEVLMSEDLRVFQGEMAPLATRRIIRYCRFCGRDPDLNKSGIDDIVSEFAERGFIKLFTLFVEADESLLNIVVEGKTSVETQNELVQPELYGTLFDRGREDYNLVELATKGNNQSFPYVEHNVGTYMKILTRYVESGVEKRSLLSHIQEEYERLKDEHANFGIGYEKLFDFKIQQLQDGDDLEGRLKILHLLVKEKGHAPPNALDAIRFRQCGILRWLVQESFLGLSGKASSEQHLSTTRAKRVNFLGGSKIPNALTTGMYLCFAAVEFDDLQSIQWLVEEQSVEIDSAELYGFNIVHTAAYFGRLEILIWLSTHPSWGALVTQECTRKSFQHHMLPVHVAVTRGHTNAADLLISLGSPSLDKVGQMPEFYAMQSTHEFVKKWGLEKARPLSLDGDMRKLRKLVANEKYELAKAHILETECLDFTAWRACDLSSDDPLPSGVTYRSVLSECFACNDESFALWLSVFTSTMKEEGSRYIYFSKDQLNTFWLHHPWRRGHQKLNREELIAFARESGKDEFLSWLEMPFTNGIECCNPHGFSPVLRNGLLSTALSKDLWEILLSIELTSECLTKIKDAIFLLVKSGGPVRAIEEKLVLCKTIVDRISALEGEDPLSYFGDHDLLSFDGTTLSVKMKNYLGIKYRKSHPVRQQMRWEFVSDYDLSLVFRVIAIEGYDELAQWCLAHGQGWTSDLEISTVRTASFLGNQSIVEVFMDPDLHGGRVRSSELDLLRSVVLGIAEAGRAVAVSGLLKSINMSGDKVKTDFYGIPRAPNCHAQRNRYVMKSLCASVVAGALNALSSPDMDLPLSEHFAIMQHLIRTEGYHVKHFLYAVSIIWHDSSQLVIWQRIVPVVVVLVDKLGLDVWEQTVQSEISHISNKFLHRFDYSSRHDGDYDEILAITVSWLVLVEKWGLDMQSMTIENYSQNDLSDLENTLADLQAKQRRSWAQFNIVKNKRPLQEIQEEVEANRLSLDQRDKGGLLLSHVASAYNRVDVLEWLVEVKKVDLGTRDGKGRTPEDVARASKASKVSKWIKDRKAKAKISSFLATHFRRRLVLIRRAKLARAVTILQSRQRGHRVRQLVRGLLLTRLDDSQRFQAIWCTSLSHLSCLLQTPFVTNSWSLIREQGLNVRSSDLENADSLLDTEELLTGGIIEAMAVNDPHNDETDEGELVVAQNVTEATKLSSSPRVRKAVSSESPKLPPHRREQRKVLISSYVEKWLRVGDVKYREFFMRRLQQLQGGDRSRILAKRMKGSHSTIFETYLEQKSGHRILWTESGSELLIWYVAKHKAVSRLVQLIDDSKNRTARQLINASSLQESPAPYAGEDLVSRGQILLDPLGNVPLKTYEIRSEDMQEITNEGWVPRLCLTEEERDIVEARGTVLLLGRSGTGKTVCICNRMDLDRQRLSHNPEFSQMFVARSFRLSRYVSGVVGTNPCSVFTEFGELVKDLESKIPDVASDDNKKDFFLPSNRIDFAGFRREVYGAGCGRRDVDPLIVWTSIRTFIKGSIEAIMEPSRVLSKEAFMNLGKKRCRLPPRQREIVYDVFEKYQRVLNDLQLWDDCDRIVSLLQRLETAKAVHPKVFEAVRKTKIYVDEVQDYTQAEILLFFKLSGAGDLFLAGDPAQSVVEGVEFRFEDIRSVGYYIADRENRRDLIPQKAKTVNVNFRTHSGILNVAAAVLRNLFRVFPDSAKQLMEDRGLFSGPRPGILYRVRPEHLSRLVSEKLKGAVVLTHDQSVSYWKGALDGYPLVYGIRAAKGLEFKSVILVDFFAELGSEVHKPWRDLLLQRDGAREYPELEGQLKLLYTGVTRCIEKLLVAETRSSSAGDAMVRWLTTTSIQRAGKATTTTTTIAGAGGGGGATSGGEALATRNNINDIEAMVVTTDEWVATGLDNAEMGENCDVLEESVSWFEKAIFCFEQAKDSSLARKARVHRSSIMFRSELATAPSSSGEGIEVRGSQMMEQLLTEGLFSEVKKLGQSLLPHLSSDYAREQMNQFIIDKLTETTCSDNNPS